MAIMEGTSTLSILTVPGNVTLRARVVASSTRGKSLRLNLNIVIRKLAPAYSCSTVRHSHRDTVGFPLLILETIGVDGWIIYFITVGSI